MNLEEFYIKIGERIKILREQKHLTQEKLAEAAGISLDYLGKIEVCINHPGLITIFKIANALNVEVKELFDFK